MTIMIIKNTKPIDYAAEVQKAADEMRTWHEAAADAAQKLAQLAQDTIEGDAARAELIAVAARSGVPDHAQLDALNVGRAKRDEAREFLQEIVQRIDASLKQAEAEHADAVRRERNARARDLADARIVAAKRWDAATAELKAALSDWDSLGQQLSGLDVPHIMRGGVSGWETATGYGRVANAFPPSIINRLFPQAQGLFPADGSLAASEANVWRDLPAA